MKKIIIIVGFLILTISSMAQLPSGVPTQLIRGWIQNYYTVPDSGTVIPKRDTSWRPRFSGMSITWQHAGVDTVQWFWNGAKWGKIGSGATSLTWQQTLSAGSVLTANNNITEDGFDLNWHNTNEFGVWKEHNGSSDGIYYFGFKSSDGATDSTVLRMSAEDGEALMGTYSAIAHSIAFANGIESSLEYSDGTNTNKISALNNTNKISAGGTTFAHSLFMTKDSVWFRGDSLTSIGTRLKLKMLGLPQSTNSSDSVLVKMSNGFLAYRASSNSGTVTSVALSMPSAFTVTGSPITGSGTFGVSGAGTTLQYIRGNGTLATFDTTAIPNFYIKVKSLQSPPGSNKQIIYNNSGAFGASSAFTWDNTNKQLIVSGVLGEFSIEAESARESISTIEATNDAGISISNDAGSQLDIMSGGTLASVVGPKIMSNASLNIIPGLDFILTAGDRVSLNGDSVLVKGIIKSSADSLWVVGPYVGLLGTNTMYKMPASGLSIPLEQVLTSGPNITTNHTTSIGTNKWIISGGESGDHVFGVDVSGVASAIAIRADITSGIAFNAQGTTGTGVNASVTSGTGVNATATSGTAIFGLTTSGGTSIGALSRDAQTYSYNRLDAVSTNDISVVGTHQKSAFLVTPAAGYGEAIDFYLSSATNSSRQAGRYAFKWTTATDASRTSMYELSTVNSGTLGRKLAIAGDGLLILDGYSSLSALTDTTTYKPLGIDINGNVRKISNWPGGSITLQQAITNGSILNADNTISIDGHNLVFNGANDVGYYYTKFDNANGVYKAVSKGSISSSDSVSMELDYNNGEALLQNASPVTNTRSLLDMQGSGMQMSVTQISDVDARKSVIIADTAEITLSSFRTTPNIGHEMVVNRDSITLRNKYGAATKLTLKTLPQSTSYSDSEVVKNSSGSLAYRASVTLDASLYTPTISAISNVDATTAHSCRYMRVGNIVFVGGVVEIDPTSNTTATSVTITLPISSTFTASDDISGTVSPNDLSEGNAHVTRSGNLAFLAFTSGTTANHALYFEFSYEVK